MNQYTAAASPLDEHAAGCETPVYTWHEQILPGLPTLGRCECGALTKIPGARNTYRRTS